MPTYSKFKRPRIELNQRLLLATNVFDLLSEDHDCFAYQKIFKDIDTSSIENKYHHLGQHAYHPKLMVSILIYAYSNGVFSSREIERHCHQDLAFMYISQNNCPNFRVLGDFRKNNLKFFHDCFKLSVKMAIDLQMASLGHISLDGSKFKANSSKHKAMSYGRLKAKESKLAEEIEGLTKKACKCDAEENKDYLEQSGYSISDDLAFKQNRLNTMSTAKIALEKREAEINPEQPIADKKQISFTDYDARIMKTKGGYEYSYNPQISVDKDQQIIVGQHVSQNANDLQEVEPALAAITDATDGHLINEMSLDNGYNSGSNLDALNKANIDAYVATDRQEKPDINALEHSDRKFVKADFIYLEEEDNFQCPGGEKLTTAPDSKAKKKTYKANKNICQECVYKSRCYSSKKRPGRIIQTDKHEALRQTMNKRMATAQAQKRYDARKITVEPAFGHIKNSGFRGFSLRGIKKVAGEFSLMCAAYNFKKMVRAGMAGSIHLKNENRSLYVG
jgi:transposase